MRESGKNVIDQVSVLCSYLNSPSSILIPRITSRA